MVLTVEVGGLEETGNDWRGDAEEGGDAESSGYLIVERGRRQNKDQVSLKICRGCSNYFIRSESVAPFALQSFELCRKDG